MRVVWTDSAKLRLREIRAFIAHDAPRAADAMIVRLVQRSRRLEVMARSGRKVPEYEREDIREFIYTILADRIDVIAVMHVRQLLPNDLKDLQFGGGENR